MKNRKKVLFFVPSTVGGAERVTLTIAKMLPRDEFEAKVVFVCRKVGDLKSFVPEWMPTHHIKIRNIYDFATFRLYRYIKHEQPYAVFSSLVYLNTRVILAGYFSKTKRIIVRNNIGVEFWKRRETKFLVSISYPKASVIVMQSKEMENDFLKFLPKCSTSTTTISNPIDIDTINQCVSGVENPFAPSFINYVYSGRIAQEKCIEVLLEAFAKVKHNITNARLTILGDTTQNPEYYEYLKNRIVELGIVKDVFFMGFQENPYKWVKYANCFVLTSRREGCPNALLEALYLKTPVVVTRSLPIIDRMVQAERGITAEVGDIDGICNGMLKAIQLNPTEPYCFGNEKAFVNLFNHY